jgi:dTDP-4-amino-4,6-dideoxygalactose transaminase
MRVRMISLSEQYNSIRNDIDSAVQKVLSSGNFIMGEVVGLFEREMDNYFGIKEGSCITCASGSDSLLLALMAIGAKEGDEIITTPFTFFATAGAIARLGAKPVFVDIGNDYNIDASKIKEKINSRTIAVITVSLYGNPAQLMEIKRICDENGIILIDDAAQSIGAKIEGKHIANYSHISTYSFFPTKNLGAYGDAGMVVAKDDGIQRKIRMLRIHGAESKYIHSLIGINSRMDTIQAAILKAKLHYLDEWISRRREIAAKYDSELKGVKTPVVLDGHYHVYHQYTIMSAKRDELMDYLKGKGIESQVYYPLPLHLQECFSYLGYKQCDFPFSEAAADKALSIPINEMLTDEQVEYVIDAINGFSLEQ